MFFNERPCAEKLDMRALKLEVGGGMEVFAAALLAVVESLLPNLTFHEGPPNCNCAKETLPHPKKKIIIIIEASG